MTSLLALLLIGPSALHANSDLIVPPPGDDGVQVFAYLDAEELVVGGEYAFVVAVELPAGSDASKAGSPAPFLQLDVPKCIKLLEPELTTYKQLADNEFLQEPFERLMEEAEVSIPFQLTAEPEAGASLGLNILAYVAGAKDKPEYFFRQRLELPLIAGAEALPSKKPNSNWGTDKKLLQIGQKAAAFSLPNAQGDLISSDRFLGKHNLIVTTYRAHW